MPEFAVIDSFRDRLDRVSGAGGLNADPNIGSELKAALASDLDGDPASDVLTAVSLVDACGLDYRVENDVAYVVREGYEPSGFVVTGDGKDAIAICRALVAELWLAHPGREAHFANLHKSLGQHQ